MIRIWLIRHAKTKGNLQRRYVGKTDESILEAEKELLTQNANKIQALLAEKSKALFFVSPMKRCIETANAMFGDIRYEIVDGFAECDFGDYEYKNYEELKDELPYQEFIDSNGMKPFPNGEDGKTFRGRCVQAFLDTIRQAVKSDAVEKKDDNIVTSVKNDDIKDIVIVAHGGTIMAIMEQCVEPHRDFYDWQVGNKEGFVLEYDGAMPCTLSGIFDGSVIRRPEMDSTSDCDDRKAD